MARSALIGDLSTADIKRNLDLLRAQMLRCLCVLVSPSVYHHEAAVPDVRSGCWHSLADEVWLSLDLETSEMMPQESTRSRARAGCLAQSPRPDHSGHAATHPSICIPSHSTALVSEALRCCTAARLLLREKRKAPTSRGHSMEYREIQATSNPGRLNLDRSVLVMSVCMCGLEKGNPVEMVIAQARTDASPATADDSQNPFSGGALSVCIAGRRERPRH